MPRPIAYLNGVPVIPLSRLADPWHPEEDELSQLTKELYAYGKVVHRKIQKRYPNHQKELSGIFRHPDLPFYISYHADLFDYNTQELIEIKSFDMMNAMGEKWWDADYNKSLFQASSYYHFTQAKKAFFSLYDVVEVHKEEIQPIPLEQLLPKFRESFEIVKRFGKVVL